MRDPGRAARRSTILPGRAVRGRPIGLHDARRKPGSRLDLADDQPAKAPLLRHRARVAHASRWTDRHLPDPATADRSARLAGTRPGRPAADVAPGVADGLAPLALPVPGSGRDRRRIRDAGQLRGRVRGGLPDRPHGSRRTPRRAHGGGFGGRHGRGGHHPIPQPNRLLSLVLRTSLSFSTEFRDRGVRQSQSLRASDCLGNRTGDLVAGERAEATAGQTARFHHSTPGVAGRRLDTPRLSRDLGTVSRGGIPGRDAVCGIPLDVAGGPDRDRAGCRNIQRRLTATEHVSRARGRGFAVQRGTDRRRVVHPRHGSGDGAGHRADFRFFGATRQLRRAAGRMECQPGGVLRPLAVGDRRRHAPAGHQRVSRNQLRSHLFSRRERLPANRIGDRDRWTGCLVERTDPHRVVARTRDPPLAIAGSPRPCRGGRGQPDRQRRAFHLGFRVVHPGDHDGDGRTPRLRFPPGGIDNRRPQRPHPGRSRHHETSSPQPNRLATRYPAKCSGLAARRSRLVRYGDGDREPFALGHRFSRVGSLSPRLGRQHQSLRRRSPRSVCHPGQPLRGPTAAVRSHAPASQAGDRVRSA